MNTKCKLGFHIWNGCICSTCGKTRDEYRERLNHKYHDWSNDCEECSKCHKTIGNQHNWSKDCEKCSKCGKTRENIHNWNGCKCSICGKIRDEEHNWNGCKCEKCGETLINHHNLENNICKTCGYEIFTDTRDGNQYKVIKIGFQTIMAENLRYKMQTGYWAYDNIEENVKKYGYLYNYHATVELVPKGWHIPTKEEWKQLYEYLGNDPKEVYAAVQEGGSSGFNALLGGEQDGYGRYNPGSSNFWSSTDYYDPVRVGMGWYFSCSHIFKESRLDGTYGRYCFSIRLFHD